ncbi:heme ABC transporter ATP-binding protein [Marinobacter sp.]|uniref:heme ABC transporter ATP-binding protein n=1 Tax=Marinobacter sp. TaxID=50741 RepID=UPI002B273E30|nr:heme ABC transporter ATP-binding protein [Marinobacter sp.]
MTLLVNNLSVLLGGVTIVRDINLSLEPGEVMMLLGPNGAGKSTLLRALSGELPFLGQIVMAGRQLVDWKPSQLARRRAVMPQKVDVNFPLTVEEVIAMGRASTSKGKPDGIIDRLMVELDITHLRHRMVPGLSGGEQQRVQLARVLGQILDTSGPRLLLLDECTSALDPAHQQLVMEVIQRLAREQGIAVLAIVHDLNLAAQFSDRLLIMQAGRCFREGTAPEVLTQSVLKAVYGYRARVISLPEGYPLVVPLGSGDAQLASGKPSCRQAS